MDRNIERMARFAQQHGVWLAPPRQATQKRAHCAPAGTCGAKRPLRAKISEAEALAEGGIRNIFISNEIADIYKLERVAKLAKALNAEGGRCWSLRGRCKQAWAVWRRPCSRLRQAIKRWMCWWKSMWARTRCGVEPGEAAMALAQAIAAPAQPALWGSAGLSRRSPASAHRCQRKAAVSRCSNYVNRTCHEFDRARIAIPLIADRRRVYDAVRQRRVLQDSPARFCSWTPTTLQPA